MKTDRVHARYSNSSPPYSLRERFKIVPLAGCRLCIKLVYQHCVCDLHKGPDSQECYVPILQTGRKWLKQPKSTAHMRTKSGPTVGSPPEPGLIAGTQGPTAQLCLHERRVLEFPKFSVLASFILKKHIVILTLVRFSRKTQPVGYIPTQGERKMDLFEGVGPSDYRAGQSKSCRAGQWAGNRLLSCSLRHNCFSGNFGPHRKELGAAHPVLKACCCT